MPLPDIQGRALSRQVQYEAEDGAANAATSLFGGLAKASQDLRTSLQPLLNQAAENAAAEDVVFAAKAREDGRTVVNVPQRLALIQSDTIYNQVARAGVIATAKADFADAQNQLATDHEFDPEGFTAGAEAFIENYTKGMDIDGVTLLELENEARQSFSQQGQQIAAKARTLRTKESQDALERRLNQVNAEIATELETGGAASVFGDVYKQKQQEAIDIVTTLTGNPAFGWSDERGAEALDGIANSGQEIVEIQSMEGVYYKDGAVAAMEYIDGAVNRMTLDQQERIGARSRMQQKLSILQQMTALEAADAKAKQTAQDDALENASLAFEADLLSRMAQGDRPSARDISNASMLVTAGAMTPARMQVYVNAVTSTEGTVSDELVLSSLYDYANTPGVTREEVEEYTLRSVGIGALKAAERESVLAAYDRKQDDRYKAGEQMLDGYFKSGFMDIDTAAVAAAKANALSELTTYFNDNPDATRAQLEAKAKSLAVEFGRRIPRPARPQIPGHSMPLVMNSDNIETASDDARAAALDAYEANRLDEQAFNRVMNQIDEMESWTKDQMRFQQENAVAPE